MLGASSSSYNSHSAHVSWGTAPVSTRHFFGYVYLILVLYIRIYVILVGIKFRHVYMLVADITRPAGHIYI